MSKLSVKKTNNYIHEHASTSFSYTLNGDGNKCVLNFFKLSPTITHEEKSIHVDSIFSLHPELFATISMDKDHARDFANAILAGIGDNK